MDKKERNREIEKYVLEYGHSFAEASRKYEISIIRIHQIVNRCKKINKIMSDDPELKKLMEVFEYNRKIINLLQFGGGYKTLDSIISIFKNNPEKIIKIKGIGVKRVSEILDYINKHTEADLDKKSIMDKIYASEIKINNLKKFERREKMLKRLKDKYGITRK